ncbi:MAG: DUF5683 domain-containing protein, partial [bacterium]
MVRILFSISIIFVEFFIVPYVNDLTASTPSSNISAQRILLQSSRTRFEFKQQILNAALERMQEESFHNVLSNSETLFPQEVQKKSKRRAFLQSLILPGWGQHYAESKTMFKVFVASEVLLWGSFLGFTTWSNWLEDDYRTFAVTHAGISLQDKPRRYFVDIGNFNDVFEFNQAQLQGR